MFLVVIVRVSGTARSATLVSMYMMKPCLFSDRTSGGRESLLVVVTRVNTEDILFRLQIDGGEAARLGSLPAVANIAGTMGIHGNGTRDDRTAPTIGIHGNGTRDDWMAGTIGIDGNGARDNWEAESRNRLVDRFFFDSCCLLGTLHRRLRFGIDSARFAGSLLDW